jgi:hypothetical protein
LCLFSFLSPIFSSRTVIRLAPPSCRFVISAVHPLMIIRWRSR